MAKLAICQALQDASIANSFSNKKVGLCLGQSKLNLFSNPFKYSLLEKLNQIFILMGHYLVCLQHALQAF